MEFSTTVLDKHVGVMGTKQVIFSLISEKMIEKKCSQHDAEILVQRDFVRILHDERQANPEYRRRQASQERREKKMYGTCESENPHQNQVVRGDNDSDYGDAI